MRKFTTVSPAVWHSPRFQELPSDSARLLYLYLLTSPHQTSTGCFRLPEGYAIQDTGMPPDVYHTARAALIEADMLVIDCDTSEVLVTRWFKHSPPANSKHFIGSRNLADSIKSDKLRGITLAELEAAWQKALEAMEAPARAKAAMATGHTLPSTRSAQTVGPVTGDGLGRCLTETLERRLSRAG